MPRQGIRELHGGELAVKASPRGGPPGTLREPEECQSGLAGLLGHLEPALPRRPIAAAQRGRSRLPPLRTASLQGCSLGARAGSRAACLKGCGRLSKGGKKKKTSWRNHIADSERVGKLKLHLRNSFVLAVKQAADNPSPCCHRQH